MVEAENLSEDAIMEELKGVEDPELLMSIVELGLVARAK